VMEHNHMFLNIYFIAIFCGKHSRAAVRV